MRLTAAVNLRAGPDNDAGVLTIIPAKAAVTVVDCDQWCQITYQGKKGFIYKSFVAVSQPAKPVAAPAAAKQPATTQKISSR